MFKSVFPVAYARQLESARAQFRRIFSHVKATIDWTVVVIVGIAGAFNRLVLYTNVFVYPGKDAEREGLIGLGL